jgi:predicted DNA binding protein
VYVIAFTAPKLPESLAEQAEELIGTRDPELDDRHATMSLVGPHEAIFDTINEFKAAGVSPDLRKLGSYKGRKEPIDALTDRQREVIRTAFDMGYYEVPREASMEQVATELGLDGSTVAEHLQRAERNVLRQILQ